MKTPEAIIKAWLQAVNSGETEAVLAFYDKSAVLIPTFSNKILKTQEDIREYFIKLESREQLSVELHEKTLFIQNIKDNVFATSGIYCWHFSVEGELLSFEARFSYVLNLDLPRPIVQHHSSQIPRML
ncbi:MAG: DUF4440 domain-containing protein [Ignavibacteriaceae bacterium]|nr:DUF4440 domain-containing protein [Ignavibacteriaceae bacterium]